MVAAAFAALAMAGAVVAVEVNGESTMTVEAVVVAQRTLLLICLAPAHAYTHVPLPPACQKGSPEWAGEPAHTQPRPHHVTGAALPHWEGRKNRENYFRLPPEKTPVPLQTPVGAGRSPEKHLRGPVQAQGQKQGRPGVRSVAAPRSCPTHQTQPIHLLWSGTMWGLTEVGRARP